MAEGTIIDARTAAALARLTDNEKECLRRRLLQQTAKEMALDLGVSPHAVEKRLKMARTKLGLSSSLEAARLLAVSEGSQRTGPQTADLAMRTSRGDKPSHRPFVLGAIAMSLVAAALIVFAVQAPNSGGVVPLPAGDTPSPARTPRIQSADEMEWVKASPEVVRAFVTESFTAMDKDKSGFIVQADVPGFGVIQGAPPPNLEAMSETEIEESKRRWIAVGDRDDDRRVSLDEYLAWYYPLQAGRGVPANWHGLQSTAAD
jgi:DNA-binding CsgD family transcriptional regulator